MQSEVMGEMETMVQPLVQKFAAPAMVGATITLEPDAASATAKSLELLAKTIDLMEAQAHAERQLRKTLALVVLWGAFLCLLGWLEVPVPF